MLFNHKLRSCSPLLLSCCLHDGNAAAYHEAASSSGCDNGSRRRAARSPCAWLRSTAQELLLPEIREKCRSIIARIGIRWRRQGLVAAASSEFGYDTMSYALNFEDDRSREFLARNLSARLPASPDQLLPEKMPREVVACR